MFLIRQSKPDDLGTLYKLARMVYFINLPPDERIIAEKIEHSKVCFAKAAGKTPPLSKAATANATAAAKKRADRSQSGLADLNARSDVFMFSIVDTETGGVIGTSQIIARMGGPGRPNWSLKLSEKKFFSKGLNFGTTHTVARLHGDESGPSEVGGLILAPSHRGARGKPGKFLSLVRFHFLGLYPERFSERVIAEMAAPVSAEGDNAFWDAVCRKFIPVKYAEADRFCQHNRDFIPELLPHDDIYLTLLPLEVLNQVAQVGTETRPARRMLENLGFEYKHHIDPFDGGPHLEAKVKDITLAKNTRRVPCTGACDGDDVTHSALISTLDSEGGFRAVYTNAAVDKNGVRLTDKAIELLGISAGDTVGLTTLGEADPELPMGNFGRRSTDAGNQPSKSAKASPKSSGRKPAAKAASKKPAKKPTQKKGKA